MNRSAIGSARRHGGRVGPLLLSLLVCWSCASSTPAAAGSEGGGDADIGPRPGSTHMNIKVGATTFRTTLYDNETVTAFRALLPLTVQMTDLNANEKYVRLPSKLPIDEASPKTIRAGDVMLYGSDTLVLFYRTFATTYRYTPIGKVDDPSSLGTTVGTESVKVTFEQ